MAGVLYGVGVGPGDPELMTLKACRLIRENEVIAVPGKTAEESTAYGIAVQAVPELKEKEIVPIYFPMVMDLAEQEKNHREGTRKLERYLDEGKNVVFLTLGDVVVYSTFSYVQHIAEADGYQVQLVNGVTSFSAAAATLGISLVEWREPLHIIPALHRLDEEEELMRQPGNYVLMKSGSKMAEVKKHLAHTGMDVQMVENCGMPDQKIYRSLEEIPDNAGYFSLIIAKRS